MRSQMMPQVGLTEPYGYSVGGSEQVALGKAIGSAIRLLAPTYAAQAGKSAEQRSEIIAGIHEELDDTDQ